MKKLFNVLLLVLFLCGVSSCKNELESMECGNHRSHSSKDKPMVKTIRMSFGGEYITESEKPLVRAGETDTYTAINVFRTKLDEEDAVQEKYAYGLFTSSGSKESVEIELITGYKYDFEATILINDVDKIKEYQGYAEPFQTKCDKDGLNALGNVPTKKINSFLYTYNELLDGEMKLDKEREYFWQLKHGYAYVDTSKDASPSFGVFRYPKVKRFYGFESLTLTNSSSKSEVTLPMKYKCFGLKIKIDGIPGGSLTVEDVTDYTSVKGESRKILNSEATENLIFPKDLVLKDEDNLREWSGVFSMNDLLADSESFDLKFLWDKGNGESEDITCHNISIRPGKQKILSVNLNGIVHENVSGNIKFSIEDTNLEEDEEVIEVNNIKSN